MCEPVYFADVRTFRDWLATHAGSDAELLVGFHKVGSGQPSMTWPQSVDEALCVGWIDGRRKRVSDTSYTIRFTPRKPSSIWSAINIDKVAALRKEGKMQPAGERAYAQRTESKSRVYSHERETAAAFSATEYTAFQHDAAAWLFFDATPPSYQRRLTHWVVSAKKDATRAARFATLMQACVAGMRLS